MPQVEIDNPAPNAPQRPRVLLAVFSAGVEPWLSIEDQVQEDILREIEEEFATTLWFQGSPQISSRFRYRLVNWLVRKQIDLLYIKPKFIRRPLKILWRRFPWKAIGSSYLFRMLQEKSTRREDANSGNRIFQDFSIQLSLVGIRTLDAMHFAIQNYEFDFLLRRLESARVPKVPETKRNLPRAHLQLVTCPVT